MYSSMLWRFLYSPADDGPGNMALDEALMGRAVRTGEAVLRVYRWRSPTLSLGRNQRARGAYDLDAAQRRGVSFVRRPTGGRALLHDHEITYSATLPTATSEEAAAAYSFINRVLVDGLSRLGVAARLATGTASIPPGLRPCFDAPSEHEIVVGARKLVGSAQWRRGGALLQHGSILVRDDQSVIGDLMVGGWDETPAAATLVDALGREPSATEVGDAIASALTNTVGQAPVAFEPDSELRVAADTLRTTYADDAWTWRR
jgi:lipoate-protein ligase A